MNKDRHSFRRVIRTNRILSEMGYTSVFDALKDLRKYKDASQQPVKADGLKECGCGGYYELFGIHRPGCQNVFDLDEG